MKKILCSLLIVMMVAVFMPTMAFAADEGTGTDPTVDYSSTDFMNSAKETYGQTENKNLFWYLGADKSKDAVYAYLESSDNGATYTLNVKGKGVIANFTGTDKQVWLGTDTENRAKITAIVVGEGITSLGQRTFRQLEKVKTLSLPSTLQNIPHKPALEMLYSLETITVPDSSPYYKVVDGVLFSKDGSTLVKYPENKAGDAYTVPNGTKYLENSLAFHYAKNLKAVTLNDHLAAIGENAFENSSVATVDLGSGVETIKPYAFNKCKELTTVTGGANVTEIGTRAFSSCSKLTALELTSKLESIGEYAFQNCTGLEKINAADTTFSKLKEVGQCAFSGSGLKEFPLCVSAPLETISKEAFKQSKLTEIIIPDNIAAIGENAFYQCPLEYVKGGKNLQTLSQCALYALGDKGTVFDFTNVASKDLTLTGTPLGNTGAGHDKTIMYVLTSDGVGFDVWQSFMSLAITNKGVFPANTEFTEGELAIPSRGSDLDFEGWYYLDGKTEKSAKDDAGKYKLQDGKKQYFAKWNYTITLEPNFDSGKKTVYTQYEETAVALNKPAEDFDNTAFDLVGWNTKADGSGTSYAAGAEAPKQNLTLYAQWGKVVGENAYYVEPTIADQTYTGSALTPAVKVLTGAKDAAFSTYTEVDVAGYTVEYKDNISAGTATATVKVDNTVIGTATFTIKPASLTATYAGETIYAGGTPALAVTVTGFVGGETPESLGADYTAPTVTNSNTAVGEYTLTPTGGAAPNYEFSYVGGKLVIQSKPSTGGGYYVSPLTTAKNTATFALNAAAKAETYEAEEQAQVDAIVAQAKADISKATTKAEVEKIQANALAALDAIPTAAEKKAETDKKAEEEAAAAAQAAKIQRLKKGVENTILKAKSKLIKRDNGKLAIRVDWTKSKGYKVDYYEVHRSVKKNSGYGKKPFFTTTDGEKCYYINTKNVKPGKTYYFYVRGVRILDGEKVYTEKSTKAWRTVKA